MFFLKEVVLMVSKDFISVCVPTYNRPYMLRDLILSFINQKYEKSELFIVDNGPEDLITPKVVEEFQKIDKRIKYIKNSTNLGFCKNLYKAMCESNGEYILLLGDDDLLLDENTLLKYVDIFKNNKNVVYIYGNVLQFSNKMKCDFVYCHFKKDTYFNHGGDALKNIWLLSAFMPGVGLRRVPELSQFYPSEDMLFPQVELIGKLLLKYDAFGISSFLIGGRAHSDQLGFHQMKGERIIGPEQHCIIELNRINTKIFQSTHKNNLLKDDMHSYIADFLSKSYPNNFPNERIRGGRKFLLINFYKTLANYHSIIFSSRAWVYFLISMLLPGFILFESKETYKALLVTNRWKDEKKYFDLCLKKFYKFD